MPITVILELEWVLRAFYGFEAPQLIRVFEHLLGLPHVNTEEAERVAAALPLVAGGIDFADALHLAGSAHCAALYTFDESRFARRARCLGGLTPVMVPDGDSAPEIKPR